MATYHCHRLKPLPGRLSVVYNEYPLDEQGGRRFTEESPRQTTHENPWEDQPVTLVAERGNR